MNTKSEFDCEHCGDYFCVSKFGGQCPALVSWEIHTTIGFEQRAFTLCEKGELKMDVWIVSLFGSVDSVWSTEQRAQVQDAMLEAEEGEGADYEKYTLNAQAPSALDDLFGEDNEPQD